MSAATVEAAGVELAFEERGAGQPFVLVHGIATERKVLRYTVTSLG